MSATQQARVTSKIRGPVCSSEAIDPPRECPKGQRKRVEEEEESQWLCAITSNTIVSISPSANHLAVPPPPFTANRSVG